MTRRKAVAADPLRFLSVCSGIEAFSVATKPLATLEQAKRFIEALHAADLMFHFEDSPETIGNMRDGEWVRCFTDAQAKHLRDRVDELYSMDWATIGHECPIGYALEVMDPDEHKPNYIRDKAE